ncbi:MAG: hypothetical protein EOP49_40120, partial [Sphingobacteriales bacterium]
MKYFSHLNTAVQALEAYDGQAPFHHYIREFLKLDKKYGSKDRKNISRLCYAGLRIGNAFPRWTAENRIRAGLFLCTAMPDAVTEQLIGDYNEVITGSLSEKWRLIAKAYNAEKSIRLGSTSTAEPGSESAMQPQSGLTVEPGKGPAMPGQPDAAVQAEVDPTIPLAIFPLPPDVFSPSLDQQSFLFSFFVQPDLFL